jgi:ribosomal protein S12 methylthiotransferase
VKADRRDQIMTIQAEIAASIQRKYLRRRLDVLIESASSAAGGSLIGRTRFQAPEVDGLVLVERNLSSARLPGPIERVEIISAEGYDLRGKIVR